MPDSYKTLSQKERKRRKTMKKTAAVVLCAAMMLTACGGASTTETTAAGSQAAGSEAASSAEETKAASGDAQKLVLSHTASAKISPKKRFTHRLRTSSAVRSLLRQAAQTTVIQS